VLCKFLQNIFSDAFCFDDGGCLPIEGVGGQQCQVLRPDSVKSSIIHALLSVRQIMSYIYSILGGWVWVGLSVHHNLTLSAVVV
jgi:hypothetical protein